MVCRAAAVAAAWFGDLFRWSSSTWKVFFLLEVCDRKAQFVDRGRTVASLHCAYRFFYLVHKIFIVQHWRIQRNHIQKVTTCQNILQKTALDFCLISWILHFSYICILYVPNFKLLKVPLTNMFFPSIFGQVRLVLNGILHESHVKVDFWKDKFGVFIQRGS